MSDRYRKLMDRRAGPGGLRNRCGCCGLDRCGSRAARKAFKRELQQEIDEEYNYVEVPLVTVDGHHILIVDYLERIDYGRRSTVTDSLEESN